jgi:MFS superfamily sulfate permease-like transporter
MVRVLLRSRRGNLLIATLGVVYAIAASAVLTVFVIDAWRASSLAELMMQAGLLACVACGVWIAAVGLQNLGIGARLHSRPH